MELADRRQMEEERTVHAEVCHTAPKQMFLTINESQQLLTRNNSNIAIKQIPNVSFK